MRVTLPNRFVPRPYQQEVMRYFDTGGKRAMWVVHRRGGKDLTMMHQTCKMAHQRRGTYWHIFPTGEQGRKAIWEGFTKDGERIMELVFPSPIRKSPREFNTKAEMVVELKCGSIWRLLGSDKISLVGAGPAGVNFSEYASARPSAWNFIAPMLAENDGWAAFITTPRGNNHAKKLFEAAKKDPTWFCELRTLYDTRAYDPEATIAAERARGMPEALIRQEYLCDWSAANVGAVYGDLMEALEKAGKISTAFKHPNDGVFTSWDLGISDSTSILFWRIKGVGKDSVSIDFIDHYTNTGKPMSHYFDEVDRRGYEYVKHWLPHDARARTLATGSSILDQAISHWGAAAVAIGPELSLLDGIQAGRWLLQQDVRFHARCTEATEALKYYHYKYDEDKSTFESKPEHDWSSHDADAYRYTAIVAKVSDLITRKPEDEEQRPAAVPLDGSFTLDELHEANRTSGRKRV